MVSIFKNMNMVMVLSPHNILSPVHCLVTQEELLLNPFLFHVIRYSSVELAWNSL